MLAALRWASFRRYSAGVLISLIGSWVEAAAYGYVVLLLGGSATTLGLIGFLNTIPNLIFAVPAGALADRFDRRTLLLGFQELNRNMAVVLAKTWATGTNYLEDDNVYPLPETMDEFKEQLAKAQVFATVPDRFKHITFVKQEQDTITVKLPPKVMIEDSEALLNQPGATYPLPPFYKRLFNGMDPVIPESEKFKVHAERIGDYTISACA